jgi:SDR family mycofactocin-dependent oxidoreductase
MGKLEGKVAFITGAGRGQGRSHAIHLAEEGADIIALDICKDIASVPYPMATEEDLAETIRQVEARGRRIVARPADVRDFSAVSAVVEEGVAELGRLDIVVANAGVWASAPFNETPDDLYRDGIDVLLNGPYYTCRAAVPHMIAGGAGGAIVIISSSAAMKGFPGQVQYNVAKAGVVGLMRTLANELAPQMIRVNTIHPSAIRTDMIDNPTMHQVFSPDKENPTMDDSLPAFAGMNLLPVPFVEPIDISHAVAFLASDEGRYITGVLLPVDAGATAKA